MPEYLYTQIPPGMAGHNAGGHGITFRSTFEQQLIYLNYYCERQDLTTGFRVYRIPKKPVSTHLMFPTLPCDGQGPYMNVGGAKLRFIETDPSNGFLVTRPWLVIL